MKCPIKNAGPNELIQYATNLNGSYAEYHYTKDIHEQLKHAADGYQFDKLTKEHEYWKDSNKEFTLWRIKLKS